MYKLRPYQEESVLATIEHFKKDASPAVVVLPTGAGKSLVIAELARKARGRVLVLAHVKELVEQNYQKYKSFDLEAGIYSAGLNKKESDYKVIFGSIQSVANAADDFFQNFSLLIIDECHRVSLQGETQYQTVIQKIKDHSENLKILGLTATPYRLGLGWIFEYHVPKKEIKTKEGRFFKKCIYELSLGYMIKNKYLTPPIKIDSPVACYDFSSLELKSGRYTITDIESILKDQKRITPAIIANIVEMAQDRNGVMIFTSSVNHAREILGLLPMGSALVTGETSEDERDEIINAFKKREIKFLVNVSVLTTGFDAPHVDVIAILRPTESVSLYQQIIGRGLRLSEGKSDCLVLDYTGQDHNIFAPDIDEDKPNSKAQIVEILCPDCGHENHFWGIKEDGEIIEHYGRRCTGALEDPFSNEIVPCGYRFRFKRCEVCGSEEDIAARVCSQCQHILVDPDKKLKEFMSLKDGHIMRPDSMMFEKKFDKKSGERLIVKYYDFDGEFLQESFFLNRPEDFQSFYYQYVRVHSKRPELKWFFNSIDEIINAHNRFRLPKFIVARKKNNYWEIREKIF